MALVSKYRTASIIIIFGYLFVREARATYFTADVTATYGVAAIDSIETNSNGNHGVSVVFDKGNKVLFDIREMARQAYASRYPDFDKIGEAFQRSSVALLQSLSDSHTFGKAPCWTVFKGADAGKSFPVSTTAVKTVKENIQKLADRLMVFNNKFKYHDSSPMNNHVESGWPTPIP